MKNQGAILNYEREEIFNQDDIEHLKYLQDIIKRMSEHSFKIKSWSITMTGGLLALLVANPQVSTNDLLVVLVPIIGFWLIDTYYLKLERNFRNRYESDVCQIKSHKYESVNYLSFGKQRKRKKFPEIIKSIRNLNCKKIKITCTNFKDNILDYISIFISISMLLTYLPLCFSVRFLMHILS